MATLADEGVLAGALEQEALIQEAFVTGDQSEDVCEEIEKMQMEDDDEAKSKSKGVDHMVGWGSWTGEGTRSRKVVEIKKPVPTGPKPTVYINRKLDRKVI